MPSIVDVNSWNKTVNNAIKNCGVFWGRLSVETSTTTVGDKVTNVSHKLRVCCIKTINSCWMRVFLVMSVCLERAWEIVLNWPYIRTLSDCEVTFLWFKIISELNGSHNKAQKSCRTSGIIMFLSQKYLVTDTAQHICLNRKNGERKRRCECWMKDR